jgi:hypothetical protein
LFPSVFSAPLRKAPEARQHIARGKRAKRARPRVNGSNKKWDLPANAGEWIDWRPDRREGDPKDNAPFIFRERTSRPPAAAARNQGTHGSPANTSLRGGTHVTKRFESIPGRCRSRCS